MTKVTENANADATRYFTHTFNFKTEISIQRQYKGQTEQNSLIKE
jgi:hypothetical protein